MSDGSKIEWTDATWNPIRARRKDTGKVGWHCERVSPACAHCYAAAHNGRMLPGCGTGLDYTRYHRDQVDIFIDEPTLMQPLKWRKPRKVFVCSMTDLFGEFVPFELVDRVFSIMALASQHTFQVLTKRPERMAEYMARIIKDDDDHDGELLWKELDNHEKLWPDWSVWTVRRGRGGLPFDLPLDNVWLGTTVENQEWADKRIPQLLKCDAAVRYLSCEPMLGQVDLTRVTFPHGHTANALDCRVSEIAKRAGIERLNGIDWVIAGGESGRGRRRMNLDWPRSLRDQCAAAGVPFFMKQIDKVQSIPDDLMVREFPQPDTIHA